MSSKSANKIIRFIHIRFTIIFKIRKLRTLLIYYTTNVLNHAVSSALQLHAQNVDDSSTITISWFIRFISKWFKIISTRTPKLTLGKRIEKFEDIKFFRRSRSNDAGNKSR